MKKRKPVTMWAVVTERGAFQFECCGLPLIQPTKKQASEFLRGEASRVVRLRVEIVE